MKSEVSVKKKLCNPPAEQAALSRDREIYGCFIGLRAAIEELFETGEAEKAEKLQAATLDLETYYIEARRNARLTIEREFQALVEMYS